MGIRLTSWNVNGIRNPFGYQPWRENRTFEAMFDILEADIVVMQETKIQRKDLRDDMVLVPGWDVYFSLPKHKKGYSGVAIYTRNSVCAPIRAEEGITGVLSPPNSSTQFRDLPLDQQIGGYPKPGQLTGVVDDVTLDSEGRCVILEFPAFVLIGTYSPANRDETRDDFRLGYLDALDTRIRNLVALGKRVVLTGDLNVVRDSLDTANIGERLKKEGMTVEDFFSMPSRRLFNQLLFEGNVRGARDENREEPVLWDLGRLFHPGRQGMYTCWDTKKNSRPGNFGSRIDYVLCSDQMKGWITDSNIQEGLMGSDHCPVFATMSDVVKVENEEVHLKDIMNPPGMFREGHRLRDWNAKDMLPMSAKLIPEFDRRQNIKDMFFRKPKTSVEAPVVSDTQSTAPKEETTSINSTPGGTPVDFGSRKDEMAPDSTPAKPAGSALKRTISTTVPSSRQQKKTKTTLAKEPSGRGQSSLMGFFKPKVTSSPGKRDDILEETANKTKLPEAPQNERSEDGMGTPSQEVPREVIEKVTPSESPKKFIDPIESKESWSKLLGKRVAPKCEHGEDCISLVTKKAGINRGRSFYICSRPLGPSGEKEKGTEWRCGTFIWSSDWTGPQPT